MDDIVEPCPIPELAEALGPYIKTRQEAAQIRDRLRAQLEHELSPGKPIQLTAINLHDPGVRVAPDAELSPAFTGVYKAYFEALKAHSAAQAKYDALKADLEKTRAQNRNEEQSSPATSFTEHLLPLLREREKRRRLQIIERAYNDVNAISEGLTSLSVDRVLARDVGELPEPPVPETSIAKPGIDVEARIIELKKAVLSAKRGTDLPPPRTPSAKTLASKTPEVVGLEEALNELTIWMEKHLAIMSDPTNNISPSAPSDAVQPLSPNHPAPNPDSDSTAPIPSLLDIQDLYTDYISARETLIHVIRNPPSFNAAETEQAIGSPSSLQTTTTPQNDSSAPRESPSELLLPYIPSLVAAKQNQDSLAQQSEKLRRQVRISEAETARLLARLAGESHLVPPGASRGADWAAASAETDEKLNSYLEQRLRAGQAAIQRAKGMLEEMRQVPNITSGLRK